MGAWTPQGEDRDIMSRAHRVPTSSDSHPSLSPTADAQMESRVVIYHRAFIKLYLVFITDGVDFGCVTGLEDLRF